MHTSNMQMGTTRAFFPTFRRCAACLGAALLLFSAVAAANSSATPTNNASITTGQLRRVATSGAAPKHYYLSLGDSYGFGLQVARWLQMLDNGTYTPTAFNTGYTDVFAQLMRQIRPDLTVVNYACPGGGGDTHIFMTDGCFFIDNGLALHDEFAGAQMDAAVAFLRAHPRQVSPITLSTSGDDITNAIANCNGDAGCVARSGLAHRLLRNMNTILSTLQQAAPGAELIWYLPHNGLSRDFPGSDRIWAPYVLELRAIAALHGVRVVDGFAAIDLTGQECQLTFICTPDDDSHPTDAGYALIGHLMFDVSGFGRQLHR